jgi:hypothetical protein
MDRTTKRMDMSIACNCNQTQLVHTMDGHIVAFEAIVARIPCNCSLKPDHVAVGSS